VEKGRELGKGGGGGDQKKKSKGLPFCEGNRRGTRGCPTKVKHQGLFWGVKFLKCRQ
jgi:hypothetical protein